MNPQSSIWSTWRLFLSLPKMYCLFWNSTLHPLYTWCLFKSNLADNSPTCRLVGVCSFQLNLWTVSFSGRKKKCFVSICRVKEQYGQVRQCCCWYYRCCCHWSSLHWCLSMLYCCPGWLLLLSCVSWWLLDDCWVWSLWPFQPCMLQRTLRIIWWFSNFRCRHELTF